MLLFDKLNLTSKREYTDEGFLRVPARIARTGIQVYSAGELGLRDLDPNTPVNIYRPEEEVFSDTSLKSFAAKPITNDHPPELVTSKNAKKYSVGMSSETVSRSGDFAETLLTITDDKAIQAVESGKVELSNGYLSDIEWAEGVTPSGEHYFGIQRNIRGNHIAIVDKGRAGPQCKVFDTGKNEGETMKIKIDGVDFEMSDQAAQAVEKQLKRLSDTEEELKKKDEELKKKEDEMEEAKNEAKKTEDSLQAKLDDAKSKILSISDIDKLAAERANFIDSATKVFADLKPAGKDNLTIMREVVANKCPNVTLDSVSEDYVKARFDMLVENVSATNPLDTALQQRLIDTGTDATKLDTRPAHIVARDKMAEEARNAWKFGGKK